jgi:hypothetical protein
MLPFSVVLPLSLSSNIRFSLICKRVALATIRVSLAIAFCVDASHALAQAKTATSTAIAVTSGGTATSSVTSGTVVTLTATVTAGGVAVRPGQVNFCDATANYCTDVHLLGTAQLTSTGTAVLKLRPGLGSHSFKAVFLGTNASAGSSSSTSMLAVTGTIPPLATGATINQTGSWGAYSLSATVTESGNTTPPTGNLSFLDTNHQNAVLGTGTLGAATRGVNWTTVNTSAPGVAGVSYAVADLNGDGIPDLFIKDYFGTFDVLLGNGDGTFTVVGSPFGPSSGTGSFVVGDFNNDGIPDVAAINAVEYAPTGTITVFLGNGDGTFTLSGSSPALGYSPTAIAEADINGDGNADLVVVQQASSTSSNGQVVIFFGNGDGTFTQASSTASIPSTGGSIIPADLNHDGHADLLVSGLGASGIAILLGNGDGTFTSMAGISKAGEAAVAVADVNNDGFPDLVFGAAGTLYLTVFLGNGDGTFTEPPSSPNASIKISGLAIADFNQDGIPDIAYTYGQAGVLFGNGDGTFVQAPAVLTYPYDFSGTIVLGDFNGDGWPDVLTEDGNSRTVIDSLTQPTETATASVAVSIAAAGAHLVDATYPGNSNYTASTSGTLSLWGVPPATTTTLTLTSGGVTVTSVAPGKVVTLTATVKAGTGLLNAGQVKFCDASASDCSDVHLLSTATLTSAGTATYKFVPGWGSHSYKAVYLESGLGLSSSSTASSLTVGPAPSPVYSDIVTIASSGLPGDYSLTATVVGLGGTSAPTGKVSFLDTSFSNTSLATASLGGATGGIGWVESQTPASSNSETSEVAGDFNGDGIPDLAMLSTPSSYGSVPSVTILLGKGDGTFTAGITVQVTGAQSNPTMIAGDFNGDGKTDLAVLSWDSFSTSYVTTLLGNGDGTFAAPKTGTAFAQASNGGDSIPGSMVAADFNGDGKMDLAIVGDYVSWGGVTILLGNGDGTFTAAGTNIDINADFGQIAAGDFNGDGIPDLIVTNYFEYGTPPTVFLGKGDGTFTAKAASFTLDYFPTSIVVGDFNQDGVLDLAFSDLNGVEIALGNGDGTFKETSASPMQVPSELLSLTAGDFNHDGKIDLAGVDSYNDRIVLLIGGGDGTFMVTATTPVVSQNFVGPFAIVAADFNEDGVPDLAMLTKNVNTASILLTEPTETATATVTGIAPIGAGTHNVDASYKGDSNYPSAVSGTVALTAGLVPVGISPNGGSFSSVQTVSLSESIPGATIYYSAYGTVNTNGYVTYTGPISLNLGGTETISAYATETGYQQSQTVTANFTLNLPAAATPVISPAAGSYLGSQTVTITDTAPGATIYYTTDGSIPTINSPVYKGGITVSSSGTVAAIAVASRYNTSAPATAEYFITSVQSRFIYTVAGNQSAGYAGDNGPATVASLNDPLGAVIDSSGNIYISDTENNVVRKVAAGTGIITTVAGTGVAGYSGDNGPATKAQLSQPYSLALDAAGNLFIGDYRNKVIRKIAAATGTITTYAGSATATTLGDGGPATSAQLTSPSGLALDAAGNLYISDYLRVRQVAAGTGTIRTFAGTGNFGYAGDKGPATSATFGEVNGLAVDSLGDLFIADTGNNVIREVTAKTGVITTVAGSVSTTTFGGDGGLATSAALYTPYSVAVDSAGDLFIADTGNGAVREVTGSNGIINTIAGHPPSYCTSLSGDGGPATAAGICAPFAVTLDSAGNVYITDYSRNRVREVTVSAPPPTKATAAPTFDAKAGTYADSQQVSITDATPGAAIYITMNGTVPSTAGAGYLGTVNVTGSVTLQAVAVAPGYLPSAPISSAYTITTPPTAIMSTVAGNGVNGASGIGGAATAGSLGSLSGVALDSTGNLYIADNSSNVVWKVASGTGTLTVAAGQVGVYGFGNGGNGVPATSTALSGPSHVAVDSAGNLYIADSRDNVVREVSAQTGIISIFAGSGNYSANLGDGGPATAATLASPQGLSFDSAGNLFIADSGHARIRKVSANNGTITTVAGGGTSGLLGDGGPATAATLSYAVDVAVDSKGTIYIADANTGRVRMVNPASGIITTVAGNGILGSSGDGGLATAAEINPQGVAVDTAGNLYISSPPTEVRMVPAGGGAITMFAGNGYEGFAGDGDSATLAELCLPQGLAFDKSGSLYIADWCNYRVRKVTLPAEAAAPSFNPPAGTYTGSQTVKITDATAGASIYYTTDGSAPTTGSNAYGGAITVSATETVKAIAVATGFSESPVASATYTIKQPVAPAITWATPTPIMYGTTLSSTQLNATTTVPGIFVYSPAAGTVLNAGQQTLNVTFTPTDTTDYAISTATVTITVNVTTPTLSTITSSLNPSLSTNSVTFAASVSAGAGTPAGSVAFYDGTTQLGTGPVSAGSASYSTSSLAAGSHSITAVYSGDQNLLSVTSGTLVQVVESYSIGTATGSSSSATASPGGQASYSLVVTPPSVGGALKFSIAGLPAGATATFSPSSVSAGAAATNVTLTITLPGSAEVVPSQNPLKPTPAPLLLGLLVLPFVKRFWKGAYRWRFLFVVGIVTLAAAAGLGACGGGNSGNTGPVSQNYTLTVTASSGSLQQSTTLTLTVE